MRLIIVRILYQTNKIVGLSTNRDIKDIQIIEVYILDYHRVRLESIYTVAIEKFQMKISVSIICILPSWFWIAITKAMGNELCTS